MLTGERMEEYGLADRPKQPEPSREDHPMHHCHECGHDARHDQPGATCPDCNDQAQLGQYAPCATTSTEPWTDGDTAELAAAMSDAAWKTADRWCEAIAGGHVLYHGLPRIAPTIRRPEYWQRLIREDVIADRMGDDPQPTDLPAIRALPSWMLRDEERARTL